MSRKGSADRSKRFSCTYKLANKRAKSGLRTQVSKGSDHGEDGTNVQYFGEDGETGDVGEYFGDVGDICAGAVHEVSECKINRKKFDPQAKRKEVVMNHWLVY